MLRDPDEEQGPILDWISTVNVYAKHCDVLRALQPGTGQWLVETESFKVWLAGSGKALWLPGIPGAGKTVLASLIVEHLDAVQTSQHHIGLAWIYCNYKEKSKETLDSNFFSIARQLAAVSPEIYNHFKSAHRQDPHNRPSPNQLLSDGILTRGFKQVFIVVDALDECTEENRAPFLRVMARLQASGANIIITGRNHVYDYINNSGLIDIQQIDVRADPEDIAKYVRACMKRPHMACVLRKAPSLQQEIVTTVVESCQGMFLIAKFQMQSLRKYIDAGSLGDALRALPKTIRSIYDAAMDRIETNEDALRVLSYLIHARRPLRVKELQHLLIVQPGHTCLHENCITDSSRLVSMCAGLVVVDGKTSIIRLVHFTVQEYFDQHHQTRFPLGDREMGQKCLAYLSFDEMRNFGSNSFEGSDLGSEDLGSQDSDSSADWEAEGSGSLVESEPETVRRHVLLDYIVEFWHYHVLPHKQALQDLLSKKPNFNVQDSNQNTPLIHASGGGYETATKFLLDHGAEVNARGAHGSTPLICASKNGHDRVVRLLLERSAAIEAADDNKRTALMCASMQGQDTVVELLLENGANTDARDDNGRIMVSLRLRDDRTRTIDGMQMIDVDFFVLTL
ncbi:hypothetical protein C8R43DRAFT_904990 [Mycena crocata]|nr:hypothetical protein C8R43DRAFT_904990 [Mycena crocata]